MFSIAFFQVDQPNYSNCGRMSPPRPTTLMLDNGQAMDLDNDLRDLENNNQVILTSTHMPRNRKKKKRAADIPVKKFKGEHI